jgi:hypothetical protein
MDAKSKAIREPARPGHKAVDPAAWTPDVPRGTDDWKYRFSESDIAEIAAAVDQVQAEGLGIMEITREKFPLPAVSKVMARVRDELLDGKGMFLTQGFPVEEWPVERTAIAYFGMGRYIGEPVSQNAKGHLLGHVKSLGGSYFDPKNRGYNTSAGLPIRPTSPVFSASRCRSRAAPAGSSAPSSCTTG